jgi:hypothetical protein
MSDPHEDLPSNVIALRGVSPRARYGPPLLVVTVGAVGLGLIFVDFRLGTLVFALSVTLALVLRIVLPTRRAGLLVVRTRVVDIVVLSILAGGLLLLALLVP